MRRGPRHDRDEPAQERRPALVVEKPDLTGEAVVGQTQPGAAARRRQLHPHPGASRRQVEERVGPAPAHLEGAWRVELHVLALAVLAGLDLEPEAAAWARLELGCAADPADQPRWIDEHLEDLLGRCGQLDLMHHQLSLDTGSSPTSPGCRPAVRAV